MSDRIWQLFMDWHMPPSMIDEKLELRKGEAHDAIVEHWRMDLMAAKSERRSHW